MIEKRVTQQLLESGQVGLTELEASDLELPEHSNTVEAELEGERFSVQWSGRGRLLTGEILAERLQDYGQVNGLLRVRLVEDAYRLTLLPPGSSPQFGQSTVMRPPLVRTTIKQKALKRRATVDRQFHSDDEYRWNEGPTRTIGFLAEARRLLGEQLKAAGFDPLELVELRLQGEELATLDDFEELLAVDVANVDRMPHQEAVARHALSRLKGRAVLADEVGLGKTIEAGLAIKELTLRGLAKRILILCPAPLRDQWRDEMGHKFDLQFDVAYHGHEVRNQDKLILSLTMGRGKISELTKRPWDIVIVDEAHRAAGSGARKTRELITSLTTACRYAFFLTATPVQNDLLELYRLVELLRPGTFTSVNEFKRKYVNRVDPRTPNDPAALRRLISSAMIRTTRAQAGVDRVTRRAVDVPVDLGRQERELYALSTDVLRNVMKDPGDTMRRRSLALRLTASPFSMGTTALRMAERHGNERVRRVLNEVGHLAMDITGSARENKALEITKDWVREHGRVLIFTQHTDTVTGLLRRMEREGLHARSFHGSMSPGERAKTIAAFRSGEAPVMISTDAGAEGQNLQFCNCVLNYDLPWNPMRIEQRIGRVDRLTQPRDEVFIANLYARNTIDESVYQLLASKLRMFELLFGQVTTILGELDDSKSASFETRVLEALFADDDAKMGRLLKELGTELVDARERASTLIAADSGMSNWMATAFDHRGGLTKEGASELRPEVVERARMRQRRVQTWVRDVLSALEAEVLHDTGAGDGAFMTVQFDEELSDELGGRTVMHLAFDRIGMEHHPDAELCAVGSPVFDELLGLLRMRGDLHATVPVIPEDIGPSPYRHAGSTTLVSRRLVPSGSWNGQATFRATVGEAETTEHIVTAELNNHSNVQLGRRELRDGESLPAVFGDPIDVVSAFEKQARSQLEQLRRNRLKQVQSEQSAELKRIRSGYLAQIEEASSEDRARLRRALSSEEKRLDRTPDIRARAKLLALTLDEDDWLVEENWSGPGGVTGQLTYGWDSGELCDVISDASSKAIGVLALCSDGHWADEHEIAECDSCHDHLCAACGDDATFEGCPVCGGTCCGRCRATTGGLCRQCGDPERAPDCDRDNEIAWRLNRGALLLVGHRVAEVVRPGELPTIVVKDQDVQDPGRSRMRAYAAHNGLPLDCALTLRDLANRPGSFGDDRLQIRSTHRVDVELTVAAAASSDLHRDALSDIPEHQAVSVRGETESKVADLLARLRSVEAPPAPPAVMVTRRATFTEMDLEADRLIRRVFVVGDDGAASNLDEQSEPLAWTGPSPSSALLAEASLDGVRVTVESRNEALLVIAASNNPPNLIGQWAAVPADETLPEQLTWFRALEALGVPGGRVGKRLGETAVMADAYPEPTESHVVERSVRRVAELLPYAPGTPISHADRHSLNALQPSWTSTPVPSLEVVPSSLAERLLALAQRPFTTMVRNGFEVTEVWSGHGTAQHEYQAYDGNPIAPTLDDLGTPAADFGICRDGHFYEKNTSARCGACQTVACRACDAVDGKASVECPSCTVQVCRRCLETQHDVSNSTCRLCRDHACADCGRDPSVQACSICNREACSQCRVDSVCGTCSRMNPAPDSLLDGFPTELALAGASVLAESDDDATTALIIRSGTVEQATIRNGSVDRWVVYGRRTIDDDYRLRLLASRRLKTQVAPVRRDVHVDLTLTDPHFCVQRKETHFLRWEAGAVGAEGRSRDSFSTREGDAVAIAAKEFDSAGLLPTPVEWMPLEVGSLVRNATPGATTPLVLQWTSQGQVCEVIDEGLLVRRFDGAEISAELHRWSTAASTPHWVSDAWNPEPALRGHVEVDYVEVVVVALASLLSLGVRIDGNATWYTINPSMQAPAATMLARSMGLEDADSIPVFTNPARIVRSKILNATIVDLHAEPVGVPHTAAFQAQDDFTDEALLAWLPSAAPRTPTLEPLEQLIRSRLEKRFRTSNSRRRLGLGADIRDDITVEGGQTWRYAVSLPPGDGDARRVDTSTRQRIAEGFIDREGHFAAGTLSCKQCEQRLCALCVDTLVRCDCCGTLVCKRCVQEPRSDLLLCPACNSMRRPTRSEARKHGRILSTRNMLIGSDNFHEVTVEHSKQHWNLQREDSEPQLIAGPAVSAFLTERLSVTR
jgi:superfamily II DNA or RNA helicase